MKINTILYQLQALSLAAQSEKTLRSLQTSSASSTVINLFIHALRQVLTLFSAKINRGPPLMKISIVYYIDGAVSAYLSRLVIQRASASSGIDTMCKNKQLEQDLKTLNYNLHYNHKCHISLILINSGSVHTDLQPSRFL